MKKSLEKQQFDLADKFVLKNFSKSLKKALQDDEKFIKIFDKEFAAMDKKTFSKLRVFFFSRFDDAATIPGYGEILYKKALDYSKKLKRKNDDNINDILELVGLQAYIMIKAALNEIDKKGKLK